MQKAQKLVTNYFIIVFLFTTYINAQVKSDAYYFADKIIDLSKESEQKEYFLNKAAIVRSELLKHYYKYRVKGFPFHRSFLVDSITGEVGFDTLETKRDMIKWKKKHKTLDSLFSEKDIKRILKSNSDLKKQEKHHDSSSNSQEKSYHNFKKWDSLHPYFNTKKLTVKWCEYGCGNSISQPFYNADKNHIFLIHSKRGNGTNIYIYRKEESDWILIEIIKRVGWVLGS